MALSAQRVSQPLGRSRRAVARRTRAAPCRAASGEEDFEAKLAAISKKGAPGASKLKRAQRQGGEAADAARVDPKDPTAGAASVQAGRDWGKETVFFEGRPSSGDVAVNVALGITLVWLPLTLAAIGRYAWVNYKITDKRVSVTKTSPFEQDNIDVPYKSIVDVVCIGRGIGLWGDMVLTLKDGTKTELRSIPQHREIEAYIAGKIKEARGSLKGGELIAGEDGVLREATAPATSKGFGGSA